MRSLPLTVKLTLAFLAVGLTGATLVAVFAWWATIQEFDRLVLEQAESDFVGRVTAFYQATGLWVGVAEYVHRPATDPPPPPQPNPAGPQPVPGVFALVDRSGRVVVPAGPYRIGDRVLSGDLAAGIELEVEGHMVGTVLRTGEPPSLAPQEERYLARNNRALLYAALGAAGGALVLGLLLARTLTHPLRELTRATRAVARGELAQQVPVRSEDELGELAAAFNQMSADLARAKQLRRQMTADIAHDLRTPLTVISGYIESLRDGVLDPNPERFEVMYQEAQHLKRLVDDLRTLSLADAGELSLNRQPVSPGALLRQVAAAYWQRAERQQVDLRVQVGPALPEIAVDPDRMAQVLGNLLDNALRHTPVGREIVLDAARREGQVLLSVRDNGAGIAPEDLPRIFERFYRGDANRRQQEGESGLGLAIVRSIVEAHGGAVSVESERGAGTTFVLALPVGASE